MDFTKENFLELFGALMGDGCISEFILNNKKFKVIRLDGHSENDYNYFDAVLKDLIFEVFDKKVEVKFRSDSKSIHIYFQSKKIFDFLKSIGFPVGVKDDLKIPLLISGLGWEKIKYLIRGLIDTDGCVHFTKNNSKINWYPSIELRSYSKMLLDQIFDILTRKGFKAYLRGTHLILYGKTNLMKWMSDIGFKNLNHISKIVFWSKFGYCPTEVELNINERLKKLKVNLGPVA